MILTVEKIKNADKRFFKVTANIGDNRWTQYNYSVSSTLYDLAEDIHKFIPREDKDNLKNLMSCILENTVPQHEPIFTGKLKPGIIMYEENESGYAPTYFGITKDAVWEVLELLGDGDDEHKRIALPYLFLDELRVYATPYRLGIIANVYPGKNEVVANIGEPELSSQIYSIYTGLLEYAADRSFAKIRKVSIL